MLRFFGSYQSTRSRRWYHRHDSEGCSPIDCADSPGMRYRSLCETLLACLLLSSLGCSSLGLSLFPSGQQLTKQASAMLDRSPRAANLPRELSQSVLPDHYLQPGDQLLIEPVDYESEIRLPADQRVMADGKLDLGKFGRVNVAGLTLEVAEQMIERAIAADGTNPSNVNVRLLEPVHRFYVLGEVNSPGSYPLVGHETVLDGILAGGGLTSAAAPCKILLARPTPPPSCRVTLPICYREITQLGDTTTNYQLQPGDRIFVASRSWCDEWKFWQASQTCQRCNACQRPCIDPAIAGYDNPMIRIPTDRVSPPTDRVSAQDASFGGTPVGPSPQPEAIGISSQDDAKELPTTSRLPTTADGELDFGPDAASAQTLSERFEPLWITPPKLGP